MHSLQAQGTRLVGDGDTCDSNCLIYCVLGNCSWVLQVRWDVHMMRGCSELLMPGRFRFLLAKKFASAMAFVGLRLAIALRRGAAVRVLSRRNAGKSSWRRTVSE